MPVVRFSRDKRGYEHIYLVDTPTGRNAQRARVLYWFRTPPGVKVGRVPFDASVQSALEAQYPDVNFDWKAITEAQPPPVPEVEAWRERRRADRVAKQVRAARTPIESAEPRSIDRIPEDSPSQDEARSQDESGAEDSAPSPTSAAESALAASATAAPLGPRRRRRGGRRRRAHWERPSASGETPGDAPGLTAESSAGDSGGSTESVEPSAPAGDPGGSDYENP